MTYFGEFEKKTYVFVEKAKKDIEFHISTLKIISIRLKARTFCPQGPKIDPKRDEVLSSSFFYSDRKRIFQSRHIDSIR